MENELDIKLENYAKSDMYPFHMPGHKRKNIGIMNPYSYDITEIDGFDVLGCSSGILKEAQQRAANLYKSKDSFYLVNGSTGGILAGIGASVKRKDKILVARNTHKSVSHSIYLNQLKVEYLYPMVTDSGILGGINPKHVANKLKEDHSIRAVVITSPTYEGVVSDISSIAEIVHSYDIPLIVDEAHGAHFGFSENFPTSAVSNNADLVIQSLHKTLPSLTQTGLLHLNSKYIKREDVERYLTIYQTSSPSYLLMAGIEKCMRIMKEEGEKLFKKYHLQLSYFYEKTNELKHIKIINGNNLEKEKCFSFDPSKIIISVKNTNMTGQELYQILLNNYHLQMEMASGDYVLAMTGILDEEEGYQRLINALFAIDRMIIKKNCTKSDMLSLYEEREKGMELYEAFDLPVKSIPFHEALGKISGSFVTLYPPGIPVIVPGEIITEDFLNEIQICMNNGLNVQGDYGLIKHRINVVNC